MIYNRNFSGNRISELADIDNGEIIEKCNLTQFVPHTEILSGKTGLTFRDCNLINCDVPGDSIIERSNNTQISFCYNLHPEGYGLDPEPENCPHVVDTDELIVDSVIIDTIYTYKDTIL